MAIPGSLEKRQRLTDDSGDQTSLTDLLHTCIKERELDSQTESAVLGLHDHTGGWTAVKIDLTLSKLDVLPEASQVMASRPVRFISGPGQSVICPYNDAHIVQSNRLLRHILKYRKNYTGPDLAVCRHRAVHIMSPAEIEQHEATCPYGKGYSAVHIMSPAEIEQHEATCPYGNGYSAVHIMSPAEIEQHEATCPYGNGYSAVHIMSPAEIEQHEATCPYGNGYSAVHIMSPAEIEQHEATCPYAWVSDLERQAKAGFITALYL
ncbi:factor 1 [Branchiostoma belcheri]|nr:factor 1 [Branchiostoma belcheri]